MASTVSGKPESLVCPASPVSTFSACFFPLSFSSHPPSLTLKQAYLTEKRCQKTFSFWDKGKFMKQFFYFLFPSPLWLVASCVEGQAKRNTQDENQKNSLFLTQGTPSMDKYCQDHIPDGNSVRVISCKTRLV